MIFSHIYIYYIYIYISSIDFQGRFVSFPEAIVSECPKRWRPRLEVHPLLPRPLWIWPAADCHHHFRPLTQERGPGSMGWFTVHLDYTYTVYIYIYIYTVYTHDMYYILYIIYYVLYIIYYILYVICYMFYVICYILYVICSTLYVIYYMLYVIYYMLYVICYILYVIYYMLYIICYILYPSFMGIWTIWSIKHLGIHKNITHRWIFFRKQNWWFNGFKHQNMGFHHSKYADTRF